MALYIAAFVRGPLRHVGVLWLGAVELGAGALFAVYHFAAGDVEIDGIVLPLIISIGLLVLLLVNMPRTQATS
jgi:hypothetical protein